MKPHQLYKAVEGTTSARGSSYAAVRSYLAGKSLPRREILEAMAQVLDVNPDWLGGKKDAPEERKQEPGDDLLMAEYGWSELPLWTSHLSDALEAAGWKLPWVTYEMKASFTETVVELLKTCPDYPLIPDDLPGKLASDVAWLVALPLRAWGTRCPSQGRWLRDYVVASLHTLRLGLEEFKEGDLEHEYPHSIIPALRRTKAGRLTPPTRQED